MACNSAYYYSAFSPLTHNTNFKSSTRYRPVQLSPITSGASSYNTLVSEISFGGILGEMGLQMYISIVAGGGFMFFIPVNWAVRLLGPPANFEASKLKVVFMGEWMESYSRILPRTYILSHCDLTANLTLTISNVISLDQLRGWYVKDDVVAEWKKVKDDMHLHVHCYASGPNILRDLAAEFRYHIFSKEMPLVLKAVLHGDSILFREHPELMDAVVWVYFHSSSKNYNRVECWGPLKDAAQGRREDHIQGLLTANKEGSLSPKKWKRTKSIFQALFAFLL